MFCIVFYCCFILSKIFFKGFKRFSIGLADLTDDWVVGVGYFRFREVFTLLFIFLYCFVFVYIYWEDVYRAMFILRW